MARTTYRTVLKPEYGGLKGKSIESMSAYASVPRLELMGTFRVLDILTDQSARNVLEVYNRIARTKAVRS